MNLNEFSLDSYAHDQFVPREFDDGGIYILEDPWTAKLSQQFDGCYRGAHPRTNYQGQRPPNFAAGRREGMRGPKENYVQAQWMRETPDERNQRFHMDSVMWDPRPPHYNPSAPMNYAHLTVLGGEFAQEDPRGAPRISPWKTKSQAMTTIDDFQGAPSAAPSAAPSSAPSSFLDQKISMRSVLLLILIIVVAMVLMVRAANSSTAECRALVGALIGRRTDS